MLSSTVAALLVCFAPAPMHRPAPPPSAYLGLTVQPGEDGVRVDAVYVNSPARLAGFLRHDQITSLADRPVRSAADLAAALRKCRPNETVAVVVRRGGEPLTLLVKLARKRAYCYLGANLTINGTRVSSLAADSPAGRAGLQVGDVIRKVDGGAVSSAAELVDAINRRRPGETVPFVIDRNGEEKEVGVKIGARPGY